MSGIASWLTCVPNRRDGLGRPQLQEVADGGTGCGAVRPSRTSRAGGSLVYRLTRLVNEIGARGRRCPPRPPATAPVCSDPRRRARRIRPERLRGPPARRRRPPGGGDRSARPASTCSTGPATRATTARCFTLAGEAGAVAEALERLVAGGDRRDRHGRAHAASTRGSVPSTSSRSCRSATRRWTSASSWPGRSARGSPSASTCRSTSTPRPRTRPDRVKLADVRRGQYEGLKAEIGQTRPRARLRAGADASRRPGRSPSGRGRS